jgi:hypothetical protein
MRQNLSETIMNYLTNVTVVMGIFLGLFFVSTLSVTTLAIGMGLILLSLLVFYSRKVVNCLESRNHVDQRSSETRPHALGIQQPK